MKKVKEVLIKGELAKMVSMAGIRVKNFRLDDLSTQPGKKGIPEALARLVAKGITTDRKEDHAKQARPVYKFCFD